MGEAKKQLLHLVFGGALTDPGSVEFEDVEALHIVGIFPSYDEAYAAWRAALLHRPLAPPAGPQRYGRGGEDLSRRTGAARLARPGIRADF